MAVDDELDVTPNFTFSTLQFESETLNVVITSFLAVLILVNIGSIITKLVYFTGHTSFSYDSWLRAFIFANSDDPLRLVMWLSRRYVYRDPQYNRAPHRLKLQRLILPLFARFVLLVSSIASVCIALPSEKKINGCASGDFEISIDLQKATFAKSPPGVCTNIPMKSRRGLVQSRASFCHCFDKGTFNAGLDAILVSHYPPSGAFRTIIHQDNQRLSIQSYIEWEDRTDRLRVMRTNMTSISIDDHMELLMRATNSYKATTCQAGDFRFINSASGFNFRSLKFVCNSTVDKYDFLNHFSGMLQNALQWTKTGKGISRVAITSGSSGKERRTTLDCPIDISVQRPIANIIPLSFALMVVFALNVIVSWTIGSHGNALDAAFHIVKDALGHDCTSNPLEENTERDEIKTMQLRKWVCSNGGAHISFIGRQGDTPVDVFPKDVIVCACVRAAAELVSAKVISGEEVPSSLVPLASPSISGNTGPPGSRPTVSGNVGIAPSSIDGSAAAGSADADATGSAGKGMLNFAASLLYVSGLKEFAPRSSAPLPLRSCGDLPGTSGNTGTVQDNNETVTGRETQRAFPRAPNPAPWPSPSGLHASRLSYELQSQGDTAVHRVGQGRGLPSTPPSVSAAQYAGIVPPPQPQGGPSPSLSDTSYLQGMPTPMRPYGTPVPVPPPSGAPTRPPPPSSAPRPPPSGFLPPDSNDHYSSSRGPS